MDLAFVVHLRSRFLLTSTVTNSAVVPKSIGVLAASFWNSMRSCRKCQRRYRFSSEASKSSPHTCTMWRFRNASARCAAS
ncbi:hypothetical protein D3C86_1682910 [compost metagenome]